MFSTPWATEEALLSLPPPYNSKISEQGSVSIVVGRLQNETATSISLHSEKPPETNYAASSRLGIQRLGLLLEDSGLPQATSALWGGRELMWQHVCVGRPDLLQPEPTF